MTDAKITLLFKLDHKKNKPMLNSNILSPANVHSGFTLTAPSLLKDVSYSHSCVITLIERNTFWARSLAPRLDWLRKTEKATVPLFPSDLETEREWVSARALRGRARERERVGWWTAREIDSRFDFLFSPRPSLSEEMFFLRLCLIRDKEREGIPILDSQSPRRQRVTQQVHFVDNLARDKSFLEI